MVGSAARVPVGRGSPAQRPCWGTKMASSEELEGARPPADLFHAHLARLLASEAFLAPPRRRRLLEYVVTQTFAGRGNQLKAYDLANSVLGREASFDAQ